MPPPTKFLRKARVVPTASALRVPSSMAVSRAVERDGGGVVEQALALDQDRQPARRAEVAEDADHGDRIGGGDDGAQQQAGDQADLREGRQGEADHQRADDDGDHGQEQDRRDVVHQTADVDHQRGLEQQGRQEDVEQGLRRDLEAAQGNDEIAEQAGHRQVLAEEHHDPKRAAGQRQHHRERQIEPIGYRRQQADQRQQAGNAQNS